MKSFNGKWFLSFVLVTACFVIGCNSTNYDSKGNSSGNITNGGFVAKKGEWIYYANGEDDGGASNCQLYKVKEDGSGKQCLSKNVFSHVK